MTETRFPTDLRRAAAFMLASALSFALMSAAAKLASDHVSTAAIVFFRNIVALAILMPWAWRQGTDALRTTQLRGHLVRGLAGLAAISSLFYALGSLRLADAVLLNNAFPLFLPIAEWLWMREPVARGVWLGLVIGFLGVVLILKPGSGVFSMAGLVGVGSAVFAAIAQVGIRRLTRTEPIRRIVFYFGLIATVGSGLALPFGWRTPGGATWVALGATGVCATVGQLFLTRAYAHAPASAVGPFIYGGVVFAAVLDWIIWRSLPDRLFVVGAVLIALAGAWMLRHDRIVNQQPFAADV